MQSKDQTLLPSAARIGTTVTGDIQGCERAYLYLNITLAPNTTETLQVSLQAKDPVSGNYTNIATFTITGAGTTMQSPPITNAYLVGIGFVDADLPAGNGGQVNSAKSVPLPGVWRATVTHSSTTAWTYSLGCTKIG